MERFLADTTITTSKDLIDKLITAGWQYKEQPISRPRQGRNKELYAPSTVGIFTREIEIKCKIKEALLQGDCSESKENQGFRDGGKSLYGQPISYIAPAFLISESTSSLVPVDNSLSNCFESIPSVSCMRRDEPSLVIALDTEFYYVDTNCRSILTWQVAFVHPGKPDCIQEVIFCSTTGTRLSFGFMLSWLIEEYRICDTCLVRNGFKAFDYKNTRRWVYHTVTKSGRIATHTTNSIFTAVSKSNLSGEKAVLEKYLEINEKKAKPNAVTDSGVRYVDNNLVVDGYINDFTDFNSFALPITIVSHAGKADLTTFLNNEFNDFLPYLSEVQGGLVSTNSFYLHPSCIDQYWKFFPVKISFRDTMCFAPSNKKKLKNLGETIGVPKIDISEEDKNNMLNFMREHPIEFAEYAINDSVIALCYSGELWGYNTAMPLTVSSASVNAAVPIISSYLGVSYNNTKESRELYNNKFRGLRTVKKGLFSLPNQLGFLEKSCFEPISDNARILQTYAKQAYKGGYNGSVTIGKYDGEETHDYDLENAYPTCMALVPDVNWEGDVIVNEIVNRKIYLQDFHSPFDLMFGYIKFKFPDNVQFPCIPVSVNGSMIFPRSSDGLNGVYASAPEIYLALCLGAEVTAVHCYVGEYLYKDGMVSRSLLHAVKQLVNDRNYAQTTYGKSSLPDQLLKDAVNCLYGKTAQNLVDKESWDAYFNRMASIGSSMLTSPTHACLTTAGVRCVLLSAMNELSGLGYKIYSVTTDGFITNAPEDVLNSLHLFGFSNIFRSARQELVGNCKMWAEKHHQNDLLNFTTRGNVSLSLEGVCAHNSFVTGFEKDSFEDRLALMTAVLGRTGRVHCYNNTWTKFKALASRDNRVDFSVNTQERALSMDFDLKRKPVKSSMETVYPIVEGVRFEIVNFETEPYDTVAEYEKYKNVSKNCSVLRTQTDWDLFFAKTKCSNGHRKISDLDWSILISCVMGYRLGLWDIPYLNQNLKVEEKIGWINSFNKSNKKFTINTWKDCRKQNRASQILEIDLIKDVLQSMQNYVDIQSA